MIVECCLFHCCKPSDPFGGKGRVPTGFGVSDVQCRCLVPGENVALQLERAFVAWPTKCFQTVMSLEPLSLSKRSVHMTENWFA